MERLAVLNVVGVAAIALLAGATSILGFSAISQSAAHPIPLLPQWDAFGRTPAHVAMGLAGVIPVVLTCYVAHQNVHPLMPLLHPYSPTRMKSVIAIALSAAAVMFLTLCVGACLAFGEGLHVNVLENLYIEALTPFVGETCGKVVSFGVRGGYILSLLGSLLLYMYPLRSCLAEMVWSKTNLQQGLQNGSMTEPAADNMLYSAAQDSGHDSAISGMFVVDNASPTLERNDAIPAGINTDSQYVKKMEMSYFYPLTYGSLLLVLMCAAVVPNIWTALSMIGNVAANVEAFIVPGLIALALACVHRDPQHPLGFSLFRLPAANRRMYKAVMARSMECWQCLLAYLIMLLGSALLVNGILQALPSS